MALRISGKFVKIWEVEVKEKFVKIKISTGDKQQDGTYKNSNWNTIIVGKQLAEAKQLKKGDVIEIANGKIENIWNADKKVSYLNIVIFEFVGNEKTVKNREVELVEDEFDQDSFPF